MSRLHRACLLARALPPSRPRAAAACRTGRRPAAIHPDGRAGGASARSVGGYRAAVADARLDHRRSATAATGAIDSIGSDRASAALPPRIGARTTSSSPFAIPARRSGCRRCSPGRSSKTRRCRDPGAGAMSETPARLSAWRIARAACCRGRMRHHHHRSARAAHRAAGRTCARARFRPLPLPDGRSSRSRAARSSGATASTRRARARPIDQADEAASRALMATITETLADFAMRAGSADEAAPRGPAARWTLRWNRTPSSPPMTRVILSACGKPEATVMAVGRATSAWDAALANGTFRACASSSTTITASPCSIPVRSWSRRRSPPPRRRAHRG